MKCKTIFAAVCAFGLMTACNSNNSDSCEKSGDKADDNATAVIIDNIMTRVSVREFTDKPIPKDTLERLVKAGMAAPSAVNAQPWAFVVVTDREVLDALRETHPYSNLTTATAAIIVCGNLTTAAEKGIGEYWVQDCSAATENILLAAHAYGLGAVWCGVYPNPERIPGVKKVLNLPDNIMPLNIITMGFPDEKPAVKNKWDPEKVHFQKW